MTFKKKMFWFILGVSYSISCRSQYYYRLFFLPLPISRLHHYRFSIRVSGVLGEGKTREIPESNFFTKKKK